MKQAKQVFLRTAIVMCMLVVMWGMSEQTMTVYADVSVYVTQTGSKYHAGKCGRGTYTKCSLSAAKARGLTPCSKCFPNGEPQENPSSDNRSNSGSQSINNKDKMQLSASQVVLVKGKTKVLKCKGGTGVAKWKSSNKKVVSVTAKGKVRALKKGTATITVRKGKLKKVCRVKVEDPVLNQKSITLEEDEDAALWLKGCAHEDAIEWWSSDEDVCGVEDDGTVYANGEGNAWIYAKVHAATFRCKVLVVNPYADDNYDDEYDDMEW